MPGMNGRELAQRMSEIRPNTKVLYMSGYTENVIGHNGTLDAGVRLLQKPFTLSSLKSKVREVLDSTPIPRRMLCQVEPLKQQHKGCNNYRRRARTLSTSLALEIPPSR
jgi:response regulator RpfG family c-di-GMP phosphodiesterase